MELWFILAVIGALVAGFNNFFYKVAAVRNYDSELFSFYSGVTSIFQVGIIALIFNIPLLPLGVLSVIMMVAGLSASLVGIMKVYALRNIDSTIYFPLFKLLSPAAAITLGITFFGESFTPTEWVGMVAGLLVPLLLITKAENHRQSNLKAGLILILTTALMSAGAAALNKYSIDAGIAAITGLFYSAIGVSIGTLLTILYRHNKASCEHFKKHTNFPLLKYSVTRSTTISLSFGLTLFAYSLGGSLAVVQTVHSLYILVPVALSILFYGEHWNTQKIVAIVLSVAALALLS